MHVIIVSQSSHTRKQCWASPQLSRNDLRSFDSNKGIQFLTTCRAQSQSHGLFPAQTYKLLCLSDVITAGSRFVKLHWSKENLMSVSLNGVREAADIESRRMFSVRLRPFKSTRCRNISPSTFDKLFF